MSHDDAQPLTEADGSAPDREPTIGERLRTAREAQPLTLTQISAELRIEQKFLKALEEDRLDEFPAPVFTKGYLRQYGSKLGVDERDLLAQYYRQVDVRDVPVVRYKPIRLRDESQIRHWLAGAAVLCLIGGGITAWWLNKPVVQPVVEQTGEPVSALAAPALVPAIAPASAEVAPEAESADTPAVIEPAIESMAGAEALAGAAAVQVELIFRQDCWTEISDAQGERLFYGLGSAGARSRFTAMLPISIFFGNAGGVDLTLNGEVYSIPADSRQGNLARFVIAEFGP